MDIETLSLAKNYADLILKKSFIDNTDIDFIYDEDGGANYFLIRVYRDKLDGSQQYPLVLCPESGETGTMSTKDLQNIYDFDLAINAGIFNTTDVTPDGIVIENGTVIKNSPSATHSQCRPLTINRQGTLGYAAYDADAQTLVNNGIYSAVCGFMEIIRDYEKVPSSEWNNVSHYTENCQRQIIGQFGNGDYGIMTCEGRNYDNSDGWTVEEAQDACVKHGFKFAYLLDGGGSTESMMHQRHINTIYESTTGRKVPTFIVFNGSTTIEPKKIIIPQGNLMKCIDENVTVGVLGLKFNYVPNPEDLEIIGNWSNQVENIIIDGSYWDTQHTVYLMFSNFLSAGECYITIRDKRYDVVSTPIHVVVDKIDKSNIMQVNQVTDVYKDGDAFVTLNDKQRAILYANASDIRSIYLQNTTTESGYYAIPLRADVNSIMFIGSIGNVNVTHSMQLYIFEDNKHNRIVDPGWTNGGSKTYDLTSYRQSYPDTQLYVTFKMRRTDWGNISDWDEVNMGITFYS